MSLYNSVIKGGFWVFSLRFIQQILKISRLVIVARILAPHDFGLLGIALLTMAILETFSETGFEAALIQKKGNIQSYLDCAWTISIIRGILLYVFLYLISPYVSVFFDSPESKYIIKIIGISFLFRSFSNIGTIYFKKELEFHKLFIYQLSGTLVDCIVSVSVAYLYKNVWALVFGLLGGNFVSLIVSYLVSSYRPRLYFNLEKAGELFKFGKWIFGSSILIFFITQGDDALVGKILGVTMLGYYQMAYKLSNMPATEISHVISQIAFPTYSKIQNNTLKLKEAYFKVLQLTVFLTFPLAVLIIMFAPDITKLFLGKKWMAIVPALQILSIFGVTRSINASLGSFFQGFGIPRIITKTNFIQLILMIILVYPLTLKYGFIGTSIAVIIPNLFTSIYLTKIIINKLHINVLVYFKNILSTIIGTLSMALFLLYCIQTQNHTLINLFILSITGIIVYFSTILLVEKQINYGVVGNIKEIFYNLK